MKIFGRGYREGKRSRVLMLFVLAAALALLASFGVAIANDGPHAGAAVPSAAAAVKASAAEYQAIIDNVSTPDRQYLKAGFNLIAQNNRPCAAMKGEGLSLPEGTKEIKLYMIFLDANNNVVADGDYKDWHYSRSLSKGSGDSYDYLDASSGPLPEKGCETVSFTKPTAFAGEYIAQIKVYKDMYENELVGGDTLKIKVAGEEENTQSSSGGGGGGCSTGFGAPILFVLCAAAVSGKKN